MHNEIPRAFIKRDSHYTDCLRIGVVDTRLERREYANVTKVDVRIRDNAPTDVSCAHFVRKILDGYAWHLRHKVSAGALPSQPTTCVNLHREV